MFSWLGLRSHPDNVQNGDQSEIFEPPETPAPLFAVKAFKEAIFGTPKQPAHATTLKPVNVNTNSEKAKQKRAEAQRSGEQILSKNATETKLKTISLPPMTSPQKVPPASPTKSILVTPGTMRRRKTVSFGAKVVDNEHKRKTLRSSSGLPNDFPGKFPSPWTPAFPQNSDAKKDHASRLLFSDKKKDVPEQTKSMGSAVINEKNSNKVENGPIAQHKPDTDCGDDTETSVDFNQPRSINEWKAEYEAYRGKSKKEIQSLIKSRRLAKSYAYNKEGEALKLAYMLKQERLKAARMEKEMTRLVAKIELAHANPGHNDVLPESLMQELTEQTALRLRYQKRVGRLQKQLERYENILNDLGLEPPSELSHLKENEEISGDARFARRLHKDPETEMMVLQAAARAAESKAIQLENENVSLKSDILRAKEELAMYEYQHKPNEKRFRQREGALRAQRKNRKLEIEAQKEFGDEVLRPQNPMHVSRSVVIPKSPSHPSKLRHGQLLREEENVPIPVLHDHEADAIEGPGQIGRKAESDIHLRPIIDRATSHSSKEKESTFDNKNGGESNSILASDKVTDGIAKSKARAGSMENDGIQMYRYSDKGKRAVLAEKVLNLQDHHSLRGSTETKASDYARKYGLQEGSHARPSLDMSPAIRSPARFPLKPIHRQPVKKTIFSPRPAMVNIQLDTSTPTRCRKSRTSTTRAKKRLELPPERIAASKARLQQRRVKRGASSNRLEGAAGTA